MGSSLFRKILWIDFLVAGALGSLISLFVFQSLNLLRLPFELLAALTVLTLAFAFYSCSLARVPKIAKRKLEFLGIGNVLYSTTVTVAIVTAVSDEASGVGLAILILEVVVVCGLIYFGWQRLKATPV